jgi:YidC/Oxa1 family membrane protein insertase
MRFLPIIFGFFLARFPSGLFVYWVTSNLITFTQNYVIYKIFPHTPADTEGVKSPIEAEKEPTAAKQEQEKSEIPQNRKKSGRAKNRKKKKVGKRK